MAGFDVDPDNPRFPFQKIFQGKRFQKPSKADHRRNPNRVVMVLWYRQAINIGLVVALLMTSLCCCSSKYEKDFISHFVFRETLRLWWPLKLSKWHGEWKLEGKTGLLSEGEITGTQSGRSRRQDWKPEPKGVITYTPKSDMTIHLGVEDRGMEG